MAKDAGVDIRMYRIIYNAIEDIEAAMKGMLTPKFKEVILGHAQVRQVFKVTASAVSAAAMSRTARSCVPARSAWSATASSSMKASWPRSSASRTMRAKWPTGFECGIGIEQFNDIKENDVIEAFEMQEIERS